MSAESPIDRELFTLEEQWVHDKLQGMSHFVEARAHLMKFHADNPDWQMNMTFRTPTGATFDVDIMAYIPDMFLNLAREYYDQLVDANQGAVANKRLRAIYNKWNPGKNKPAKG